MSDYNDKEEDHGLIANYFDLLEKSFNEACISGGGKHSFSFQLADHDVEIICAGSIPDFAEKAFSHLPSGGVQKNPLQIMVWDEKKMGVLMPPLPWLPSNQNSEYFPPFSSENYFVIRSEHNNVFYMYDINLNKAIVCIKSANTLPNYFLAAPFFKIIKLWSKKVGLNILHAGCISNGQHSILLVGKGGMGKSTTSIQCLTHGLKYISDDYLLVRFGNDPMAYSIYCTGKLHTSHLKNFPEIAVIAKIGNRAEYDKPFMYLTELFTGQVIAKSPVKAIVAPHITTEIKSYIKSCSSIDALKALAPSTLIQLNLGDNGDFAKMADLTRALPCYRLELGSELKGIAPVIEELLNRL